MYNCSQCSEQFVLGSDNDGPVVHLCSWCNLILRHQEFAAFLAAL